MKAWGHSSTLLIRPLVGVGVVVVVVVDKPEHAALKMEHAQ